MIELKDNVDVVAIGDSITFGYPYGRKYSWVNLASKRLGITISNKGEPGETTRDMLARFEKDVVNLGPKYVIILGGTNDAFSNIPSGFVRNNVYKMVQLAEMNNIIPIIALPIPVNEESSNSLLDDYRTWMKTFAEAKNYLVLDFYSLFLDPKTGLVKQGFHEDGVHPSKIGYEKMSEIVKIKS